MYLGIEIGGTKLQVGVAAGDGPPLTVLERISADPSGGARGILAQIEQIARPLRERFALKAVGIGFGGPVNAAAGRTIKSHQVDGWDDFPLVDWCQERLGLPGVLGNDSDLAGLAEALFGAGRGHKIVVYSNVGSGIGGAVVIDGQLHTGSTGVASEIGHLRPGPQAKCPEQTVESLASGWGIANTARTKLQQIAASESADVADLLARCDGLPERITTAMIAQAATEGNSLAHDVFAGAVRVYGWALAQVITLLAPSVIVIGGGVPLAGEALFFGPLREQVRRYTFPPLRDACQIVPAGLGEEVVVHGALALAARQSLNG